MKKHIMEKGFFIKSVPMIKIDGSNNVPTALYYKSKDVVLIGDKAKSSAESIHKLNENFKMDLGNTDVREMGNACHFTTACGEIRSSVDLTNDFFKVLMSYVHDWLDEHDASISPALLISEPLSLQCNEENIASDEWLSIYRHNIKFILDKQLTNNVDFLPEPLAVFQYYRHSEKHPLLQLSEKFKAMVIDFGGGTFDISIIETTAKGEIDQRVKNNSHLSAASTPIGGYYVNQMIVHDLMCSHMNERGRISEFRKGVNFYNSWRKGNLDLFKIPEKYRYFLQNYHQAIHAADEYKITLVQNIISWDLDKEIEFSVTMVLPDDPFTAVNENSDFINKVFSADAFRQLFVEKIWNPHLRPVINMALDREGIERLEELPVSLILLSGGSANIGWLRELIKKDFGERLEFPEILELEDYQEVVAKGLAVECTRRFYSEEGDFSSVTYNRLCLILKADDSINEICRFRALTPDLPDVKQLPGVLLPSATTIRKFINKPMIWRVKMKKGPKHRLDYFFLRSNLDPTKTEHLFNPQHNRLFSNKRPSSYVDVELTVKNDGTARPAFIYSSKSDKEGAKRIEAEPFPLDMTYAAASKPRSAYLGLDFGTTNTAISYVDELNVKTYQKRVKRRGWREIGDLIQTLPYPLSVPLGNYVGESRGLSRVRAAREFVEAALCLGAYVAYSEYCAIKGYAARVYEQEDGIIEDGIGFVPSFEKSARRRTKLFKELNQRSLNPLYTLLKRSMEKLGDKPCISAGYNTLIGKYGPEIEAAILAFNDEKHDKISGDDVDHIRAVKLLANVSSEVFSKNLFGFFSNVTQKAFSHEYRGKFIIAKGPYQPSFNSVEYEGDRSFSQEQSFLINSVNEIALQLTPLIFWFRCDYHPDLNYGHCYLYDKVPFQDHSYLYKASGFPCICEASTENHLSSLVPILSNMREEDPCSDYLYGLKLVAD